MGRGRAKAKQTKVARDLKYNTPNTDLSALQAELSGGSALVPSGDDDSYSGSEELVDDPYAKYYEDEDESEESPESSESSSQDD
ncbi:MAG: DUF3073 domain-containing protein [Actinobacteria bacterium]|nr:DUF3073 domain-containing protein [Actinomycetota bacterium]NBY15557.1 DUF3073 domain-containing protein [Actinomycetota bacterium]